MTYLNALGWHRSALALVLAACVVEHRWIRPQATLSFLGLLVAAAVCLHSLARVDGVWAESPETAAHIVTVSVAETARLGVLAIVVVVLEASVAGALRRGKRGGGHA